MRFSWGGRHLKMAVNYMEAKMAPTMEIKNGSNNGKMILKDRKISHF
jgi:hypothetical protein